MEQNKNYIVRFLADALDDLTEIISSFVMLGSKQGAKRIQKRFNKAAEQIGLFPYSGISVPDEKLAKSGFRMIVVENYLMFYKIFEESSEVIFYRVLNGKRNYPALMRALHDKTK